MLHSQQMCDLKGERVYCVYFHHNFAYVEQKCTNSTDCEFFVLRTSEPFYFPSFPTMFAQLPVHVQERFLVPIFFWGLIKHKCLYYFIINILSSYF